MTAQNKKVLLETEASRNYDFRVDGIRCWSTNVASAAQGFKQMGYELQGFRARKIEQAPLHRNTIVKGSIRTVRTALELLGVPQPENLDIPPSLMKYTYRNIWLTTMGAVRKANKTVFIKPAKIQKAFRGHVFFRNSEWRETSRLPASFEVMASEMVDFETEWRTYVLRGEILGIKSYEGEYMENAPPKLSTLKGMIADFKNAPVAYAMDVGLIRTRGVPAKLALVEVNEGFALGNYGISDLNYARMVEARWKEMVSQ